VQSSTRGACPAAVIVNIIAAIKVFMVFLSLLALYGLWNITGFGMLGI